MISIDLGTHETKIIEGKVYKDGVRVTKSFSYKTPFDSYENGYIKNMTELLNVTKEELRNNKIKAGDCYVNIKSTSIVTREIVFPLLGDKEITGLLQYQLPEYLPMDAGKYIVQHKPLGKVNVGGVDKLYTLIVAIPKEVVDCHFSFIKELDLRPMVLDYQCNALWKLLKYSGRINDDVSIENRTIATVDLGYSNTSVTIIKNGKMQFCRVLDIGGAELDSSLESMLTLEKSEVLEKKKEIKDISIIDEGFTDYNRLLNIMRAGLENIMERIDRIFRYYMAQEAGNDIHSILLFGGLSGIVGVDKLFSRYYNIPVSIIQSLNKIYIQNDINKYINCISALLRDDEGRYK